MCSIEIVAATTTNETIACSASNYSSPSSSCSSGYTYESNTCSMDSSYTQHTYICIDASDLPTGGLDYIFEYSSSSYGLSSCEEYVSQCDSAEHQNNIQTSCEATHTYSGNITCNQKLCADGYTAVGSYCYK